ncbi:MAG TPA: beta-glucosidase BglX [Sphingobium sp.]|uniref:beta-glucosidase BglX n=1 Tax=Sphingobium sp. TaxID=1912891 RepID=UPI002ED5D1C5
MNMLRKAVGHALLAGSILAMAASGQAGYARSAKSSTPPGGAPGDTDVTNRAKTLLAKMTPEEKAGQLSQYFYFGQAPATMTDPIDAAIAKGQAGALLFITDPAQTNKLQKIAVEQTRMKIPLLFGFDVIHGLRTIFPAPIGMAASWDPAMVEQAQGIAAAESRAVGLHWTFAPMVDIARDARWGRIFEGAGEDPYLGSAMAAAQVRGFQGRHIGEPGHIIAGPKHFAGYGAAMGGRDYDEVDLSDNLLWNVYLPPFKAAVDAGAGNIMSAYMALNGEPATANHWLLTKVLRDTWGFKGFVVSDADAVNSLTTHGLTRDGPDAALRAVKAGLNMEMIPPTMPGHMGSIATAVAEGRLTTAELDKAVQPILEMKIRMGLFENPYVDASKAEAVLNDPAHRTAALHAAERSAVLLRNENALLPLDRTGIKSIAVIGPLADSAREVLGSWVFPMNKAVGVGILAGITDKVGKTVRVDYSAGVNMPKRTYPSPFVMMETMMGTPAVKRPPIDDTAEIARAVGLAKNADVSVLVLGESQEMSGEMASRASFDLPGRQQELLDAVVATGKPVVVLLMSARPLNLKNSKAGAILDLWYPGSEGGHAAANLLFGDAVPGGKLPISWIPSAAQAPTTYSYLISHDQANAMHRYWDGSNEPTYAFGHGLSYTSFTYSNLHVQQPSYHVGEPVKVSVDLTNSGKRTGDEVAQLYIHQRSGTSSRPIRELKGFQRVTLKPGETRTLQFTLTPSDLRYWSAVTRDWVQDESAFDIWAGGSSNAALAGSFEISGR